MHSSGKPRFRSKDQFYKEPGPTTDSESMMDKCKSNVRGCWWEFGMWLMRKTCQDLPRQYSLEPAGHLWKSLVPKEIKNSEVLRTAVINPEHLKIFSIFTKPESACEPSGKKGRGLYDFESLDMSQQRFVNWLTNLDSNFSAKKRLFDIIGIIPLALALYIGISTSIRAAPQTAVAETLVPLLVNQSIAVANTTSMTSLSTEQVLNLFEGLIALFSAAALSILRFMFARKTNNINQSIEQGLVEEPEYFDPKIESSVVERTLNM